MPLRRLVLAWGACLVLAPAALASTFIRGGGSTRTDCYAVWKVTAPETVPDAPRDRLDCVDGDPSCDADGQEDGVCTVLVSVCVLTKTAGCSPAAAGAIEGITTHVFPRRFARRVGVRRLQPPTLPATVTACGRVAVASLPVRTSTSGAPTGSRPLRFRMIAHTHERRDSDHLTLRCLPAPGPCPPNPAGGPSSLVLTTRDGVGSDLDLGWDGTAHGFRFVGGATLDLCLADCDAGQHSRCTAAGTTGYGTRNGTTFGPPVPMLAAGTPICMVDRFGGALTGSADYRTGEVAATVPLLADVYLTTTALQDGRGQVCPQCSGSRVGDPGVCIGGRNDGQACHVEGTGTVVRAGVSEEYLLSAACTPLGSPLATLALDLNPLATGTATGGTCPGQARDDACPGSTCDQQCTGNACVSTTGNPVDPAGPPVCLDAKGGLSQLCCGGDTTRPCFPTRNGGQITRTGLASQALPDGSAPFPATSHPVLASILCAPASDNGLLDGVFPQAFPAPAALVVPMTGRWQP